jgi:hypothetical protein
MSQENVEAVDPMNTTTEQSRVLAALITTVAVIVGTLLIAPATQAHPIDRYCTKPYCVSVLNQDGRLKFKLKAFSVWGKHSRNYTSCVQIADAPKSACHHRQHLTKHGDFWSDKLDFRREFPNFPRPPGNYLATWFRGGHVLFPSLRFRVTPHAFVQALETAGLSE